MSKLAVLVVAILAVVFVSASAQVAVASQSTTLPVLKPPDFSERLWQTVKVEEVYLRDYQTVAEATYSLGRYFEFYNNQRLHQALDYCTPAEVYDVAVGTPVALRAPFVPTALTYGDESTLKTPVFCLDNG